MLRQTRLIQRDDIWNYIDSPLVSKVTIARRKNVGLTNPALVKIYSYWKLPTHALNDLCGNIQAQTHNYKLRVKNIKLGIPEMTNPEWNELNAIISAKSNGFVRTKDIQLLLEYEKRFKMNFMIPSEILDLLANLLNEC